jgi:serine/threonine-protein kinase
MGEVYRARDLQLSRNIALKILPDHFASDPERLARFGREAQVLASLNHPNIAQIYAIETTGSTRALVMELVEGQTLADRIGRGPIPIDEALPIAKQIAEALEAAHEQGIIHRDLKPANIKIRPDGTVKVLDFGLAKLAETTASNSSAALANSPTITSPAVMTGVGVPLGTAAYMSPEQAKGRPADKRADVWAFGCVLYEMLAAKGAFKGESVTETLAAVLRTEPDWSALPADVSAQLRSLLRRLLAKDPKERVANCSVVRYALSADSETHVQQPRRQISSVARRLVIGVALLVVAALGWALRSVYPGTSTSMSGQRRFAIQAGADFNMAGGDQRLLAISPDGSLIAFVADGRLNLRPLDQLRSIPIPGTNGASEPFFSPDGRWIGFWQDRQLKKIPVSGGSPVKICDAVAAVGATWNEDGTIVFADGAQLCTASPDRAERLSCCLMWAHRAPIAHSYCRAPALCCIPFEAGELEGS